MRDLLPRVQARTLVMHVRGDLIAPLESGREVAAGIRDARFVAMEGRSHLVQESEPAFEREEIRLFLSSDALNLLCFERARRCGRI